MQTPSACGGAPRAGRLGPGSHRRAVYRKRSNQVCPTSYDLGEAGKIDLLPYVPFRPEVAEPNAKSVHPEIEILRLSCSTNLGVDH
jgi:hypothetical protein